MTNKIALRKSLLQSVTASLVLGAGTLALSGCFGAQLYPQYTARYRINLSGSTLQSSLSSDTFRFPNTLYVQDKVDSSLQHVLEFRFEDEEAGPRFSPELRPATGGFAESLTGLAFFAGSPGAPLAAQGRNVLPNAPIQGGLSPGCFARYRYELTADFSPSALLLRDAYSPYDEDGFTRPPGGYYMIKPNEAIAQQWRDIVDTNQGMKITFTIDKRPAQVERGGCSGAEAGGLGGSTGSLVVEYISDNHDETLLVNPMLNENRLESARFRYSINGSDTDLQTLFGQLLRTEN
jgi:hypothetical protein